MQKRTARTGDGLLRLAEVASGNHEESAGVRADSVHRRGHRVGAVGRFAGTDAHADHISRPARAASEVPAAGPTARPRRGRELRPAASSVLRRPETWEPSGGTVVR